MLLLTQQVREGASPTEKKKKKRKRRPVTVEQGRTVRLSWLLSRAAREQQREMNSGSCRIFKVHECAQERLQLARYCSNVRILNAPIPSPSASASTPSSPCLRGAPNRHYRAVTQRSNNEEKLQEVACWNPSQALQEAKWNLTNDKRHTHT